MAERTALITGIAGGLAREAGRALQRRGYRVVGVDYRALPAPLGYPAEFVQASYNKTYIEDAFRQAQPEVVLHLGRVGNLKEQMGKRFDLNVIGSRKVMDLALKYGARRLVVLSTFHIYGAHPHNHIPINEEEPLRAGAEFPQLADAIQLDNQALQWLYRHPEVPTVILRPCNVIGSEIQNAMSNFLRMPAVPFMMGFDPMVQFIDQRDLVSALLAAIEGHAVGVFNVAGRGTVPWREALSATGSLQIPVPSPVASAYLRLAGLWSAAFPPYLINFFMYPCVITDDAFRRAASWEPEIGQLEAVRATVGVRGATPVGG
ncbi:MAG: NAD-dependent epimerase/dehydratase family protein [Deltaproteobacteria bacterium]|nr:NAD-dependent epimerase/dehydratase family protein [Deltaproteobacteria bacterium]